MRIPASGPLPMRASCSYFPGISRVLGPMSSHISSLLVSHIYSTLLQTLWEVRVGVRVGWPLPRRTDLTTPTSRDRLSQVAAERRSPANMLTSFHQLACLGEEWASSRRIIS